MRKAVNRSMSVEDVHLLHKSGGQSSEWNTDGED
jgi:molybdenum cofactor biosynthesis enzyme